MLDLFGPQAWMSALSRKIRDSDGTLIILFIVYFYRIRPKRL